MGDKMKDENEKEIKREIAWVCRKKDNYGMILIIDSLDCYMTHGFATVLDLDENIIGKFLITEDNPNSIDDIKSLEGFEVPIEYKEKVLEWSKGSTCEHNNWLWLLQAWDMFVEEDIITDDFDYVCIGIRLIYLGIKDFTERFGIRLVGTNKYIYIPQILQGFIKIKKGKKIINKHLRLLNEPIPGRHLKIADKSYTYIDTFTNIQYALKRFAEKRQYAFQVMRRYGKLKLKMLMRLINDSVMWHNLENTFVSCFATNWSNNEEFRKSCEIIEQILKYFSQGDRNE